jgi:hypothetical protein
MSNIQIVVRKEKLKKEKKRVALFIVQYFSI